MLIKKISIKQNIQKIVIHISKNLYPLRFNSKKNFVKKKARKGDNKTPLPPKTPKQIIDEKIDKKKKIYLFLAAA